MKTKSNFCARLSRQTQALRLCLLTVIGLAQTLNAAANYELSPGDTISMLMFQEPDMRMEARVAIDGTVQFPLIGRVKAAGKSLQSLQQDLFERYDRDYFVNPQISLQILDYAERRIRVRGKVSRPGFVLIPPEEEFTLLDAIAAAGDVISSGNEKKVELHRTAPDGSSEVRVFDLSKMQGNQQLDTIELQDDDVIVVPEKLF